MTESKVRSPTFFLAQLQPRGPLTHRDEGHVVVHHGLVKLVVRPPQSAESKAGIKINNVAVEDFIISALDIMSIVHCFTERKNGLN